MKNVHTQPKKNLSDAEMLKYKNFNQVLNKHESIKSSYKKLWSKIYISIGAASIITVLSFFAISTTETDIKTSNNNIESAVSQMDNTNIKIEDAAAFENPELTSEPKTEQIKPLEKSVILEDKNVDKSIVKPSSLAEKTSSDNTKVEHITSIPSKQLEQKNDQKTTFKIQPEEKKNINLPSLLIASKPSNHPISKRDLVNNGCISSVYESINKEYPIANFEATFYQKGKLVHLKSKNGFLSPEMIREVHRSEIGDSILFSNISVFIPGQGMQKLPEQQIVLK